MSRNLRDNKRIRWGMLLIISFVMFAVYIASDNIFSVEKTLMDPSLYDIAQNEYDNLAGAASIFNVYCLLLIFGGIILDKKGIRFTGIMACILMVIGGGLLTWSLYDLRDLVASGAEIAKVQVPTLGIVRVPALIAIIGMGLLGGGAEIAGVVATKAIAKWFLNYELAIAMGLQLALARLGSGLALGVTPFIVTWKDGNVGFAILIGLILLVIGLITFLYYCIYDKKLDMQTGGESASNPEELFHMKDILVVIKNPAFWLIAILCMLFYGTVNPFLKYSTGMIVDKFGVSSTFAGLFPQVLPLGCIILTPLFGYINQKKGHSADLMIFGAIIITAVFCIFAIPSNTSKAVALVLMALLGVGFAMLPAAMWPAVAKIMPPKILGTAMALIFYVQNIGYLVIPKVIGPIKNANTTIVNGIETCDYTTVLLFLAILGFVSILTAIALKILDRKKGYNI